MKIPQNPVIKAGFIEALQRDPSQQRRWLVLVDGHPHQIRLIDRVMKKHNVKAKPLSLWTLSMYLNTCGKQRGAFKKKLKHG
ncbi:MAG: hypothetical protein ACJARF_002798 [Alteromonadaceae bacterium]